MLYGYKMNEQLPAGAPEHELRGMLVRDILGRTNILMDGDDRTARMTYDRAIAGDNHNGYNEPLRRATIRGIETLNKMLDSQMAGAMIPALCHHQNLMTHDTAGNSLTYGMTEVHADRGGWIAMMTLSVGNGRAHRVRGALLRHDGMYSTTNELRPLDDTFATEANRMIDAELAGVIGPLLNGRLLPGQELLTSLAMIRQSIMRSGADADIDAFMNRLIERYDNMQEVNEFRKNIGMQQTEMTAKQLQELCDYLAGDASAHAMGIYDD